MLGVELEARCVIWPCLVVLILRGSQLINTKYVTIGLLLSCDALHDYLFVPSP